MGSSPYIEVKLPPAKGKSGSPTVSYTQSVDTPGPDGTEIFVDVTVTVQGPNAITNVDVDPINGSVSVNAGLSAGNFSVAGASSYSADPTVDQFSFSYSQTDTVGKGSNADKVVVSVNETIDYPEYSSQAPDFNIHLSETGVLEVIGSGIVAGTIAFWRLFTAVGEDT